jgi:2',3'-cyclic-nucleotide 2'-phosphodiesterase / 3'-nucleotidase
MKAHQILLLTSLLLIIVSCSKTEYVKIAVTTDVHGMIYPLDLIEMRQADHSLAHVSSYLKQQRKAQDTSLILLDNGDFLQGQPTVYFFNTRKKDTTHISAQAMNYMAYDAATVGNHDIETGPDVYNKITDEFDFPWLAANAINIHTNKPGFEPYAIINKGGRKIAILGLITPGIPHWLPKSLWPDLRFEDMIETAHQWVPYIQKKEKPELIVGLFHSGTDPTYGGGSATEKMNDNAVRLVAEQVPGFDIIFAGHDHRVSNQWIINVNGDSVLVMDPGSHARYVGETLIDFSSGKNKKISGRIVNCKDYQADPEFMTQLGGQLQEVTEYLSDTVTSLASTMSSQDGLFGPSSFISLIHKVQLKKSGTNISFTAPLAFNSILNSGPVLVSDMFKLYRFENMLYTMKLTGSEIEGFLEHSASLWFNNMDSKNANLLKFNPDNKMRLRNQYYNFSSAAGIDYTIDLQKPDGEKVTIHQKSDGTPFLMNDTFLVAINSYRGNGGGGHLTRGSEIPAEDLSDRVVKSTQIDLRYYLMQFLDDQDIYYPDTFQNWKLVPEEWWQTGEISDRKMLFN